MSPIVATLVLVVVAIVGATAVGMILGTFSNDVSSQANSENIATSASSEIIVAGSTTVQPVSEKLSKEYMAKNPGVKVTVQAGGSGAGIASAGMGIVDIGAASKFMSGTDKEKYPDLQEHVIGGSAVVVFVNDVSTGVWGTVPTKVTKEELQILYNTTTAAAKVNGSTPLTNIHVYHRSESSGTEETFAQALFGSKVKEIDMKANTNTVEFTALGNQALINAVAQETKNASIGFADYGLVADAIKDGKPLKILKIEYVATGTPDEVTSSEVKASVKALLAGTTKTTNNDMYPVEFCRPLVYLTNGEPSSVVNNFLQFSMSPGAIESFAGVGYFAISDL